MAIEIRTGNTGLAQGINRGRELIHITHDPHMHDYRWQGFRDGQPITRPHDITERVAPQIRELLDKHGERTTAPQKSEHEFAITPCADGQMRLEV